MPNIFACLWVAILATLIWSVLCKNTDRDGEWPALPLVPLFWLFYFLLSFCFSA